MKTCKSGHALTPENVRAGRSWSECKTCARDARKQARKAGVSRTTTIGLTPWNPRPGGNPERILRDVLPILEEWVGGGIVPALTPRAILYRMLPLGWTKADDEKIRDVLERARRSGKIPFEWIADGRSITHQPHCWEDMEEFKTSCVSAAENFRLDRLQGQPNVEVWVEAAGMMQMLEDIADELGARLVCSSGHNTLTAKYEAAKRVLRNSERGTVIIFVGDLDADGEARYANVREDVLAIAADLCGRDHDMRPYLVDATTFQVAAITREQVAEHEIPTEPADEERQRDELIAAFEKIGAPNA